MRSLQFVSALGGALVLAFAIGCSSSSGNEEPATNSGGGETAMATASAVLDVMNQNCVTCHSGEEAKEDLHLDSIEGVLNGGEHGAVVVAGDPASSKILSHVRGDEGFVKMPPAPNDPLSADAIKLIEDWIAAGAPAS